MPGVHSPTMQPLAAPQPLSEAPQDKEDVLDLEKKSFPKSTDRKETSHVAKVLFYCGLNAIVSASLIAFNKYLMHKGRFPYAAHLVGMHTTISTLCVSLFFLLTRGCSADIGDFFSTLPMALADKAILGKVAALGSLFAVQLVFCNAAYLYSNVVFIQMMKEGNIPFVYLLSVIAALEIVHWQRIRVLFFIVFATILTLRGELNFVWLGFIVQGCGQAFEAFRIVLQAVMLNGKGLNLDVMTYMLLVMPASAIMLFGVLGVNSVFEVTPFAVPSLNEFLEWWPLLILNALVAVALNFTTALVVKHASAVGLVLSGLVKDSMIILVGACILAEPISTMQVVGFSMQMTGIFTYSMIKLYPERFEDGIHLGFKRIATREAMPIPPHSVEKKDTYYGAASTNNGNSS